MEQMNRSSSHPGGNLSKNRRLTAQMQPIAKIFVTLRQTRRFMVCVFNATD